MNPFYDCPIRQSTTGEVSQAFRRLLVATALLWAAGSGFGPAARAADNGAMPAMAPPVAGDYRVDHAHTSVVFRVNHLGYSQFTARFDTVNADLTFDPASWSASHLDATIDANSIDPNNPPPGFVDLLRGPHFLDAAKYRQIRFRSTAVREMAPHQLAIAGTLTLHGVTRPLELRGVFNGGYGGMAMDPHARIGFSAQGSFKRSDFGMSFGLPPPGSTMGVGDNVDVSIEVELTGPAWAGASAKTP